MIFDLLLALAAPVLILQHRLKLSGADKALKLGSYVGTSLAKSSR
jgi:hypothetical protein